MISTMVVYASSKRKIVELFEEERIYDAKGVTHHGQITFSIYLTTEKNKVCSPRHVRKIWNKIRITTF